MKKIKGYTVNVTVKAHVFATNSADAHDRAIEFIRRARGIDHEGIASMAGAITAIRASTPVRNNDDVSDWGFVADDWGGGL